jgi:hypothetical protein
MRIKPELKGALLTLLCIALILVGFWIFIGVRNGIWTPVEYGRFVELTVNLPVAHLLWQKEINAGDDAEQLIKEWRPHTITRYGPWIEMRWFPGGPSPDTISFVGIYILAKNGKLVLASCYADDGVDQRIFFDTLTPADKAEERAALIAYVDKIRTEREKNSATNGSQQFLTETNQIEKR